MKWLVVKKILGIKFRKHTLPTQPIITRAILMQTKY
jgi:hypothetical protein